MVKRSRYSDEQIAYALRQAESGTAVADVCRQLGISEAIFYVWKKKYGSLCQVVFDFKTSPWPRRGL
jgi:putative transposase